MTPRESRIRELERWQSSRRRELATFRRGAERALQSAYLMRMYTENWDGPGGSGPPCTGVVTLTFTCGATPQSGVSVTITNGTTSFTGTTNGSGQVSFTPGAAGTWTGTATKSGYVTRSFSFGYTCEAATYTIGFGSASTLISGLAIACGSGRAGILIEALDSTGLVIGSAFTDSSGNYSFGVTSHLGTTLTIRASGGYLVTQTTTRTVTCGGGASGVNFAMSLQSGKRCVCTGVIADANTLNFSSTGYATSLAYGTSPATGNSGVYHGTILASCKAVTGSSCAKSVADVTVTIEFNPSTCILTAYFKNETVSNGNSVCPAVSGVSRLPCSDARCAALPEAPLFSTNCSIANNGSLFASSTSGPPAGSPPFIATFTGTLMYDADGAPFLINAVVSE